MTEEKLNTGPEDVVKDDPGGAVGDPGDVEVSAEQIEELMAAQKAVERAPLEAEGVGGNSPSGEGPGGNGEKVVEAGVAEKAGPTAPEPEKPRRSPPSPVSRRDPGKRNRLY